MNRHIRDGVLPYGTMIIDVLNFLTGHAIRNEVELMLKTLLTESAHLEEGHVRFWRTQQGGGPACGIFQMEPETGTDLLLRYLPQQTRRKHLPTKILQLAFLTDHTLIFSDNHITLREVNLRFQPLLIGGDKLACALARVKYLSIPDALPPGGHDVSAYYKQWYNSPGGAGSVTKCEKDWAAFEGAAVMEYLTPLMDG